MRSSGGLILSKSCRSKVLGFRTRPSTFTCQPVESKFAAAVEEQGAATHEIASSAANAKTEAGTARASIGDVAGVAGETTRASVAVSMAAETMATELKGLEGEIATFLGRMRAA